MQRIASASSTKQPAPKAGTRTLMLGVSVLAMSIASATSQVEAAGPCTSDTLSIAGTNLFLCGVDTTSAATILSASESGGNSGDISGGGLSGSGANGLAIYVDSSGVISTTGNGAPIYDITTSAGNSGSVSFSGITRAGGSGGTVTLDLKARLQTIGDNAPAVRVRSIAGASGSVNDSGLSGVGGSGGAVAVLVSTEIQTNGLGSAGVWLTSVGGNSGDVSNGGISGAGGRAGNISLTVYGSVIASGPDADGVTAESTTGRSGLVSLAGIPGAGGANGDVTVTVSAGTIRGGSGTGVGIRVTDGANVTIENFSGEVSALSGTAILAFGNNVRIANTGTVIGNITAIGNTSTTFDNAPGGRLEPGTFIDLHGATLTNYATISPGGRGTLADTVLTGNLDQRENGTLEIDADWTANKSDLLDVTGTATLAGTILVNPINFPDSSNKANEGLTKTFTAVKATGGITDNGITVTDTAAVDYTLRKPDANTLDIEARVNFLGSAAPTILTPTATEEDDGETQGLAVNGLTTTQTAVGANLNAVFSGGQTLDFMPPMLMLATQQELGGALTQLAPVGDGGAFSSSMTTATTFANQMLSCRIKGDGDAFAVIREGQCLWSRANVRRLTNDGASGGDSYRETSGFYSSGLQVNLGGDWRVGGAVGYEKTSLSTESNATSDGHQLHLGGIVKYNPGPWLFAASVTGGLGWYDNERHVGIGTFSDTAHAENETNLLTGRLTAAYLWAMNAFYLKPQVDVAATRLNRDGYVEEARTDIALAVDDTNATVYTVAPSIELGTEVAVSLGIARPFIRGGLSWQSEDTFSTTASFAAVPAASAFTVLSEVDPIVGTFAAGFDLIGPDNITLRASYEGKYGELTRQHTGSMKLSVPF